VGVIKPAFVAKQSCQGVMNLKQLKVPVEREPGFEGCLEMVNSLLCLALGSIGIAEGTM